MAVNLTRKVITFAQTDTVPGTPNAGNPSVSTDAMLMFNEQNPVSVDTRIVDLTPVRGSWTKSKRLVGRTLHQIKPTFVLQGSGTPGTPPFFGPWLKATGLNETSGVSGGTSYVAYTPIAAGGTVKTVTAWTYVHDILHKIGSAVGNIVYDGKAGDGPLLSFDGQGLYTSVGSQTAPTGITYPTDRKLQVEAEAFAIAGLAAGTAIVQSLRFDFGTKITERPDYSSSKGLKGLLIIDKMPTINLVMEAENSLATHDWWADVQAANDIDITWQHGSVAGNIAVWTVLDAQLTRAAYGDANGIRTFSCDLALQNAVDEAEMELRFK